MSKIVFYNRKWSGCAKAREFLSQSEKQIDHHDVRKEPISESETLKLLKGKKLYLEKKGKSVKRLSAKEANKETLLKMFLGRSGTLRAPVLMGDTWAIAGFEEETYRELLDK